MDFKSNFSYTIKSSLFRLNLISLFAIVNLTACGGGGGGGVPAPEAPDTVLPFVTATIPASEQFNTGPNDLISIKFNESIDKNILTPSNVQIYRLVQNTLGEYIRDTNIIVYVKDAMNAIENSTKLTISLPSNSMALNNRYEITVNGITDTAGNTMVDKCQWIFTTGQNRIETGKTGLCGSAAIGAPSVPQNITAIPVDNNQVLLKWKTPILGVGGLPTRYKVDKIIGNQLPYIDINLNIPADTLSLYDDNSTSNGVPHTYRVTAINDKGDGVTGNSNDVTPLAAPAIVELQSPSPSVGDKFGLTFAFDSTGNVLAIAHNRNDVKIYNRIDNGWKFSQSLARGSVSSGIYFGAALAFNHNGKILAIGTLQSNDIHIYVNENNSWKFSTLISSQTPDPRVGTLTAAYEYGFGTTLAFNFDGSQLATKRVIVTTMDNIIYKVVGVVDIYNKVGNAWQYAEQLAVDNKLDRNLFGDAITFSKDGTTLAIGDKYGDLMSALQLNYGGAVHLFNSSFTGWTLSKTIISDLPSSTEEFGAVLSFSPDSNTLAVSSNPIIYETPFVYLFSRKNNWNLLQKISDTLSTSDPADPSVEFGTSHSFSADSSTLAIMGFGTYTDSTVTKLGAVQLFTVSNSVWSYSKNVYSTQTKLNHYYVGHSAFSPNGNALAVSDLLVDIVVSPTYTATSAGIVAVFDLSQ
ncbi:MAG: Ig-like domain-containing protein [Thiohalomonadales bacterium]